MLEILENTTVVLVKATFNDLQELNPRINGHDEDLDILDKHYQHFMTTAKMNFYRTTMALNNHHLAIKMQTKPS